MPTKTKSTKRKRTSHNTDKTHHQETKCKRFMFSDLFGLIDGSRRIVVKTLSHNGSDATILYESSDKADVMTLRDTLESCLEEPMFLSQCRCLDNIVIFLYDGEERNELLQISNHPGSKSIRCSLYANDLPLINREKWLQWFDDRNIRGPREEISQRAMRKKHNAQAYRKWVAAMPRYLKGAWKKHETTVSFYGRCPDELRSALHRHLCGKTVQEKITDILIWYGSTTCTGKQCRGHLIYERVAEALLLDFDVQDIFDAIVIYNSRCMIDTRLIHGAVKLFSGFRFPKKYPNSLKFQKALSEELFPQGISLKKLSLSSLS
jgi:hypothetical protein